MPRNGITITVTVPEEAAAYLDLAGQAAGGRSGRRHIQGKVREAVAAEIKRGAAIAAGDPPVATVDTADR